MPLIPFSPPPGINSDDTTFAAEGKWAGGDNVRFRNGKPQTVGGVTSTYFTFATPARMCRDIFVFSRSGGSAVAYGQAGDVAGAADGILSVDNSVGTSPTAPTVRTPASLSTNANKGWCFASWGNTLLAAGRGGPSSPGGRLYEQTGTSTATHVTQAPARNTCILVTNERQALSFGCNEEVSTTFNPMCIRGSDLEDYTDWTTTASNNAFEHILDGGGEIVTAHRVGAYIGVWTTSGLWLGQFFGDPSQTYRFDKVVSGCCPASIRAVQAVAGVAYWFDRAMNFWAWSPGSSPVQIACPVSADINLAGNLAAFEVLWFATFNPIFQEVWFFYASDGNANPTSYVAYSIAESAQQGRPVWFKGALDRVCVRFDDILPFPGFGVNASSNVFGVETDGTCISGAYIQSADWSIGEGDRRVMIRSVRPDFELLSGNAAALNLTVYVRGEPQAPATTKGPYAITSATTKKDFRASGRLLACRLASTDTDGWRFGRFTFDVVPTGER